MGADGNADGRRGLARSRARPVAALSVNDYGDDNGLRGEGTVSSTVIVNRFTVARVALPVFLTGPGKSTGWQPMPRRAL